MGTLLQGAGRLGGPAVRPALSLALGSRPAHPHTGARPAALTPPARSTSSWLACWTSTRWQSSRTRWAWWKAWRPTSAAGGLLSCCSRAGLPPVGLVRRRWCVQAAQLWPLALLCACRVKRVLDANGTDYWHQVRPDAWGRSRHSSTGAPASGCPAPGPPLSCHPPLHTHAHTQTHAGAGERVWRHERGAVQPARRDAQPRPRGWACSRALAGALGSRRRPAGRARAGISSGVRARFWPDPGPPVPRALLPQTKPRRVRAVV